MSVQAEGRFWSGIDVPKTIAGTLAAVSAAVLGSFLGVAGTLIGAALASVISSIGTEIYHRSIDRGAKRLQSAFVIAPAAVGTPSVEAAGTKPSAADGTEPAEAAGTKPSAADGTEPAEAQVREDPEALRKGDQPARRIHWKRVALVAGAFFVLGMGTLTAAELFAGRSAADVTSGRDSGSPTIVFDQAGDDRDEKKPAVVPSADTTADATTDAPAPTEPATGTTTPAEPAPTSEGPTATTPAETPTPDENDTGTTGPTGTSGDIGAAPEEATGETGE
ncbi:hypothetical protein AB0G04_29270 [Actinoplanes sp. NPDC023801]|uniref:hypothetical protein n=1 Tax=Actinoplanes sp. NPDC023801 TaxID=3154595 RepID=UPI0033D38BFE